MTCTDPSRNLKRTAEELRELLSRDFTDRRIEPGKKRTVNRVFYRKAVGLGWWNKFSETESVFDEFDERVRVASQRSPEEIADMNAWLTGHSATHSLDFHSNRLSRRQFADAFGLDIKKIDSEEPEISQLLYRWDTELSATGYRSDKNAVRLLKVQMSRKPPVISRSLFKVRETKNVERRTWDILEELLDHDFQNDRLVVLQSGLLSREHYASRLGMDRGAMTHYRPLFLHYEALLGGLNVKYEADLCMMEAWLNEQIDEGKLGFQGGKFDRKPFCERFSIKFQGHLTTHSVLKELVLRTDKRLRDMSYRPGVAQDEIESLQALLINPRLNSDKLRINQAHISTETGIARQRLNGPPFREMIREAELTVLEKINADPMKLFKHGKVLDFSPLLLSHWSPAFVRKLTSIVDEQLGHRSAEYLKRTERVILSLFHYLGSSTLPAVMASAKAIREQTNVPHALWTQAILGYGRAEVDGKSAKGKRHTVSGINTILVELGAAGLIPDAEVTIPLPRCESTPRQTIAEVFNPAKSDTVAPTVPSARSRSLVAFSRWVLMQKSAPGENLTSFESDGFLIVLEEELSKSGSLPADPVEAIMAIMNKRLKLISTPAERRIAQWQSHHQRGQRLVARGVRPSMYQRYLPDKQHDRAEKRDQLSDFFPPIERGDQGLCNLLRLIADQYHGVFPAFSTTAGSPLYDSRVIREAVSAYGGIEHLQAYLLPHRHAVASSIVLYLVETGANIAVARTLLTNAVEEGDGPEFSKITGKKSKAKGKPVIMNLLSNSPCVTAMEWIVAAFRKVRRHLGKPLSTTMFLRRSGGKVHDIGEAWFGTWFRDTYGEIDGLNGVVAAMIRPTVILKHSLENDGDLRTGLAYGQHTEEMGGIYQDRLVTKYLREKLWKEFSHTAETIIIHDNLNLQKLIGVSPEDNEARVAEARKTGLGGFCTAGGCEKLDCWNKCPNHAIIADPHLMAELQVWNASLKEVEGEWIRDRIERWQEEWFPWLWYTEVIEQKMRQGSVALRRIWTQATKIKEQMLAQPGFVPPRPF